MNDRVSSGIKGLDDMTCGGFKKGSNNIIVGEAGTGKSTIATQFLVEGMKNGEGAVYVSLEEKKEKFVNNMEQFGFKLGEYEKKGLFKFVEVNPKEIVDNIEQGIPTIETPVKEVKAKRLVIDSVTAFLLIFDSEKDRKNILKQLFDKLDRWKLTMIMISEAHQEEARFGVSYLSDSIVKVDLKIDPKGNSRILLLEVYKMRGTKHKRAIVPFSITDTGVEVYPEQKMY